MLFKTSTITGDYRKIVTQNSMMQFLKQFKLSLLFVLIAAVFYGVFGYDLARYDFIKLITLYGALFYASFKIIQLFKWNLKVLLTIAILFRLVFIVALPNLSQDYFRFIWDGRLLLSGINPYLSTPNEWILAGKLPISNASELILGMGELSASHFTNYPPVNQLLFALASLLSPNGIIGSVVVMRILIIAADLGTLFFGSKLLKSMNLPEHRIFLYVLNPFVIIEFTGNLHFEGVMLFFVIASIYLLSKRKWFWSAVLLGISVSVKLLPLLFLPLFWQILAPKKEINTRLGSLSRKAILFNFRYYAVVLATVALSFLPFLSEEFFLNFGETMALWFAKFEFNASIFYVIRWVGFLTKGYDVIGESAYILPFLVLFFLIFISFFRKIKSIEELFTAMLFGISFYFLLATTVHPWYIATPLLLSIFTKYRFPIVWSAVVFLSYSAYKQNVTEENLWLVALEYIVVISYALWELTKNKSLEFQNTD